MLALHHHSGGLILTRSERIAAECLPVREARVGRSAAIGPNRDAYACTEGQPCHWLRQAILLLSGALPEIPDFLALLNQRADKNGQRRKADAPQLSATDDDRPEKDSQNCHQSLA